MAGNVPASRKRPTIRQVAELAEVSVATVSEVLNQRPNCWASQATRQRIVDAARKIGYRPNPAARAMRGQSTHTIGLVVPGLDVESSARIFTAFEAAARENGKLVFTASTRNEPDREDQAVEWLLDHNVDALVVSPTETGEHASLHRLVKRRFPVVAISAVGHLPFPIDCVSADQHAAGRLQVQTLHDAGRRNVLIVRPGRLCRVTEQKLEGIALGLDEHADMTGRTVELENIEVGYSVADSGTLDALPDILRPYIDDVDAVICIGDAHAFGVIRALVALDVNVPGRIAVISNDGIKLAAQCVVPLTTIINAPDQIGREAFRLLADQLASEDPKRQPQQVMVPPALIPRASA